METVGDVKKIVVFFGKDSWRLHWKPFRHLFEASILFVDSPFIHPYVANFPLLV